MDRVVTLCFAGLLALGASGSMYDSFVRPDDASRPWTYWLWENSHVDEKTIREDLADIANLGFGAVLMSDSRGYWDDEDHVAKPPPKMTWGSGEWLDSVAFAIRTCAENGLGFTMNVAASGGKLNGGVKAGADAPKVLVCRRYAPGVAPEPLEGTGLAEIALFSVDAEEPLATTDWVNAGDGFYTMSATSGRRADGGRDLGRVSFACPRGISAPPPDPVVLPELVDFVSRDDLCHFSGTAVYRTAFDFAGPKDPSAEYLLTLGWYRTGLAHVYLNGTDCGTVWCFPHEADVTAALKEGRNELEIRYVNNWCNRLVGDAKLPESERVTKTVVRFKAGRRSRGSSPSAPWYVRPTPVSGYVAEDTLQSSGLMGRVRLDVRARIQGKYGT